MKDWKPEEKVQKQVEEKLENSLRLKGIIKWIQKEQKKKSQQLNQSQDKDKEEEESIPGSFTVSAYTASFNYHLQDSFILNSGANLHVCNCCSHLQNFRPASEDEFLYAENTIMLIEGYGSTNITV